MNLIVWKNIDWQLVNSRIDRYQRRIYKASNENNERKIKFLQKKLINSLDARLLAVRRITTENKGKSTAGIDNKLYNTDSKKVSLTEKIHIDGKANPIKRVLISKPGRSEKTPLGIPTIEDRAKQFIVLLALEPQWEAKFEPNSYGFRPGRSCADAVVAIFGHLRVGKNKDNFNKYILDADLKGCFDNIDHSYLLNKLNTLPELKTQIKAWLEAGIINNDMSYQIPSKNNIGTPQGISPFLANVALHGMETHLKEWIASRPSTSGKSMSNRDKMNELGIIRYADDFLIIHRNKKTILDAKTEIEQWLSKTSKLELNTNKTDIISSKEGFRFLGFRFINVKRNNKMRIKIYPDKESVKNVTLKIGNILRTNRAISSYDLIQIIRPIIVGWCNYYCISECNETFSTLNHKTYLMLRTWVFRRDKRHGKHTVKEKYFTSKTYTFRGKIYNDNWVLNGKKMINGHLKTNFLPKFTWTESQRHIKVRPYASIFDGNHEYDNRTLK
jgi:RNA-directed DNA polymerase